MWTGSAPMNGGCIADPKIDGWHGLHFRDHEAKPRLWTMNGHEIHGAGHILHKLAAMEAVAGEPMMFDGEFQVDGCLSATKAWCETGYKTGGEAGTFFLFDCLTEREWRANDCDRPLIERKAMLKRLFDESERLDDGWEWRPRTYGRQPKGPIVEIIEGEWCNDVPEIMDLANRVWATGGEGLVIKDAESIYRRERSKDWLKVKHPRYKAK
jgi:ATP-dependent DNA ligase